MVQGHTIPRDQGWLAMIAKRNNMTYVNYGVNGIFMTNRLSGDSIGVVDRFMSMDDDADYIIVFAGTNDADKSYTIMGEDSSTDPSEFKGALNVICSGLLTKYPKGKIMFITPYRRNENYVKYAEDCSFIWMIAAGCTIKYVDIPFIWYEYGSGISTQGSDRWLKIIYEDNRNVYKLMLDSGDIKKWVYNISYSNNKFVKITLRLFVFGVMKKIKNIFKEKQNNLMKKDF